MRLIRNTRQALALLALALGCAALSLSSACSREGAQAPGGLALAPVPQGGDFTLDSADGPVSSRDYRGKVIALYFGYTSCPDVCPTSLATLAEALAKLSPAELAGVQPLFVSVDPERDNVARLKEYALFFHPKLKGLTGTPQQLAAMAQAYGASYAKQDVKSEGGYVVDHSSFIYLVAADGRLAASLPHGSSPDAVATALRTQLAAQPR